MKCFLAILLVALFFGRPTHGQHSDKVAERAAELFGLDADTKLFKNGSSVAGNELLECQDFYIFTVGKIKGQTVSVGFLRMVIPINSAITLKLLLWEF